MGRIESFPSCGLDDGSTSSQGMLGEILIFAVPWVIITMGQFMLVNKLLDSSELRLIGVTQGLPSAYMLYLDRLDCFHSFLLGMQGCRFSMNRTSILTPTHSSSVSAATACSSCSEPSPITQTTQCSTPSKPLACRMISMNPSSSMEF